MDVSRRLVLTGSMAIAAGAAEPGGPPAPEGQASPSDRLAALRERVLEFRTFEDFGAVGDFDMQRGEGTDDTAAIQSAIDWAYGGGRTPPRALLMTAKNFLCGPITTYPCTTIIGTGRHTSNFCCRTGTTGKWWSDRGNGALKTMLAGIAWYGRKQPGLTHIAEFGDTDVQFGTEGILEGLWFRDAPNGYGLLLNANVGVLRDIALQGCSRNLKILGNANLAYNLVIMEPKLVGAELYGTSVDGLHIEATDSDGLPLLMYGDCRIDHLTISSALRTSFSHLIEVDTRTYDEWAVDNVQLLGANYAVRNGMMKVGAAYQGGTSPGDFTGSSFKHALDTGRLSIRHQAWQSFALQLVNEGGVLRHRIGSQADPLAPSALVSCINGASPALSATPVLPDQSGAFSAGGMVGSSTRSRFILDTPVAQAPANQGLQGSVVFNDTGTFVTAWCRFVPTNVRGVRRERLVVDFHSVDGTPYDLARLPRGKSLVVGISGFIA